MMPRRSGPGRANEPAHAGDRLDRAGSAPSASSVPPPATIAEELARRARELARAPEPLPGEGRVLAVVVFALDREQFAIEARYVRRVERLDGLIPVPGAPDRLLGVANVRGEVLAVFDLRRLIGGSVVGDGVSSFLIILGQDRDEYAFGADDALELRRIGTDSVLEPPEGVSPDRPFIRGVTAEALILLDGAALIRDERLTIDQDENGGG